MELRDGFIDNVFNYCDRWCETCPLTSWCRLFADDAQAIASLDPQLKALVEAPALRQEIKAMPAWMEELLEKLQDGLDRMSDREPDERPIDDPLLQRASAYGMTVHTWLGGSGVSEDPNEPRAIIAWFATLIPAKIARAIHGLGYAGLDDPDEPTDYDGSAKVALIGIARSRAAWQELAASETAAGSAIAELTWLETEIERMFPRARQFIRPAFDEPDEVARLLAERDAAQ